MVDERKIKEIQRRVKNYISDGIIITKQKAEHVDFFKIHSKNFLDSARAEYLLSTNKEKSESLGFFNYNGLIVVVNSSYYSMFHMARALLESDGIKIKTDKSIHSITFDAIVYFFYLTKKLEKRLIEYFLVAKEEVDEIQGRERAKEMINELLFEKRKRSTFTYKMGTKLVEAKAKTSLNRAIKFHAELNEIIKS